MSDEHVRWLGALVETLHAVVYFAPEPQAAYGALGLRGYWRGYFASRTAAVGTPSADLVTALVAGFAPSFVARAVPEVWRLADRRAVLDARRDGAVAALRRLLGEHAADRPDAATTGASDRERADLHATASAAAELTARAVDGLDLAARPMAAAHAALPRPVDPLAALWHDCTVLREHRGDGHLAAVLAAGLRWPEPHVLAAGRVDARQQALRGWSDAEWAAAQERARRLPAGVLDDVEAVTDRLAAPAYAGLDASALVRALAPLADAVVAGGGVPFPNAMGLLRPAEVPEPAGPPAPGTPGAGA